MTLFRTVTLRKNVGGRASVRHRVAWLRAFGIGQQAPPLQSTAILPLAPPPFAERLRAWLRLAEHLRDFDIGRQAPPPQSKAISPLAPPPSRVLWLGTWLSAFGMGRPAPPGSRRWISRLAHSVADGGWSLREASKSDASESAANMFSGQTSAYVANFAFRVWLWVLWDEHNGCSRQQSRLSESARAGWVAGISNPSPSRRLSQGTSTCV